MIPKAPYPVHVDRIAQTVSDEVRDEIIRILNVYDFPYVTSVENKGSLRNVFLAHFRDRSSLSWLIQQVSGLTMDNKGVVPVARTEPNRLHTKALGTLLLSQEARLCTTVHSYSLLHPMSPECRTNLEGKVLEIETVIRNSFPATLAELNRKDIPMVPQHPNCRHILAPSPES